MVNVIKRNGSEQKFDANKIKNAIRKSANRVCVTLTEKEEKQVVDSVKNQLKYQEVAVPIDTIHNMVEVALDRVNQDVAKSYREYRDNRKQFSAMLDKVYSKKLSLNFIGDRSNANADSALVTTQKAIVYNELNSELYKKFFLTQREERAVSDGYIYIHDRGSRLDTINCFARETEFITINGIQSFKEFKDGDKVRVPTHKENWKWATVHSYGKQELFKVTFKREDGQQSSVICTRNHRWILKGDKETTALSVGDELIKVTFVPSFGMGGLEVAPDGWKVESIEETGRTETVWCLDVEEDHSFILKYGIPTGNCCIFDMKNLITGGFFMGNLDYQEPKSLDVAFDLIGDVTLNAAASQYGGFTIPEIDKLFAPYAEKSYQLYLKDYLNIKGVSTIEELSEEDKKLADEFATNKVRREFEQGFQSWEMKFNSVASSRGDYPFTAITFGLGTGKWETMASSSAMKVRKNGQGNEGFKHPVLFPKLSFFYDEELHGDGKKLEWLFNEAIECSMKTMYPDFISLTGDGYAPTMYKKYGVAISRMGCVDKESSVTVMTGGEINSYTFEALWNSLVDKTISKKVCSSIDEKHFTEYIDLNDVKIFDIDGFVKCNRIIRNHNEDKWIKLTLKDSGKTLICTEDHPITLQNGQTKKAVELIETDGIVVFRIQGITDHYVDCVSHIEKLDMVADSFDVTTESGHFVVNGIWSHNCRAQTSPWYIRGGMEPADEDDTPVYEGRFNMGAISLHFSMIAAKAKKEDKDFFDVLKYYLDMVRGIHIRTVEFLSHKKAGINPLGFCQGGFYGGHFHPDEEIGRDFLKPMTISFGVIGLNEASVFVTGKSIHEDNSWAIKVMKYINEYADKYKKEDGILYAVYGTPGESLVATQALQFKKKYGVIKNVSDREYVTNSFHCHVSADITPVEKQNIEYPMFHLCNGGNIGYGRLRSNYNFDAFKAITKRAMNLGFYWGNNQQLNFCEYCGKEFIDADVCPHCGSSSLTRITRMSGYLSYESIRGKTMYSDSKLSEFKERKSM